jgi:hypothetical protein
MSLDCVIKKQYIFDAVQGGILMAVHLKQKYYTQPIKELFGIKEKLFNLRNVDKIQIYGKFVHHDQQLVHQYMLPVIKYEGIPIPDRDPVI